MKRLKIYLDTSVINFLFADDAPNLRDITKDFFENCVQSLKYDVFISNVVLQEIEKTKDEGKKKKLLDIIRKYKFSVLQSTSEVEQLADVYIKEGIVPAKKVEDAQHIAIATCNQMDLLLSWNFKHLANIHRQIAVRSVNERQGYFYPLTMTNPMEALNEED
ncbi:MAG: type II toxin-antitoxin system VapC family toxin [Candidatus Sumerlaeota bacterium]|nr:type II toxin-antitoxin system VapC family toxin [Candidatus Sumerlaeota bacterium]